MIAIGEAIRRTEFVRRLHRHRSTAAELIGAAPTAGSPTEAELGPLVYPAVLDGGPYSLILSSTDPGAGSRGRHY